MQASRKKARRQNRNRRSNRIASVRGMELAQSRGASGFDARVPKIPMTNLTPMLTHAFLFKCVSTAPITTVITRKRLLDLMGVNIVSAGGANSYARIFGAVRLRRIRMWSNVVALGTTPDNVSLEYDGLYTPSNLIRGQGSGVYPGYIESTPPGNSDRWWSVINQNESEGLFALEATTGAYLEITLDIALVDNEGVTYTSATAAGTLGRVYGTGLETMWTAVGLTPVAAV